MYLKIYELDSVKFISATGLGRQAALKKTSKIRTINWYWLLLMAEKESRGGICGAIHKYPKANNK